MECQGECKREGICEGIVETVAVWGNGFQKAFTFNYCQTAISEDKRRGFFVEKIDEHGLTASDYYTGITQPNG